MTNTAKTPKIAAQETIASLPDDTTWDEAIYRLYVRQKIEAGIQDSDRGDLVSVDEVRRRLELGNGG